MNVLCSDLLSKGIVSENDLDWVANVRIPYNATGDEWLDKHRIDKAIKKAINDGVVNEVPREEVAVSRSFQIIGDYINSSPGEAVKSMADGKMYDSKSAYYRAVKEAGCEVLGTDAPRAAKPTEPRICEKELKADIATAINQLGG